jgi:SAM-dependent methyltransferase
MDRLRPYQYETALEIQEKMRVLVADQMGMGKCAEIIHAKNILDLERSEPAIIVCPSAVIPHWVDEIRKWYRKGQDTKIATIRTASYDPDVRNAKGADFTLMGYCTLSYYGNDEKRMQRLIESRFGMGVLDEGHNIKNPESIRSRGSRDLFHSTPYLAILTGTPIPNTVVDIYSFLNLLDATGKEFPIPEDKPGAILPAFYDFFRRNPYKAKTIFDSCLVGGHVRKVQDYLDKKVPEMIMNNLDIKLTGEHEEVYRAIYENEDIGPGQKLGQLRAVALDPNLADSKYLPRELARRIGSMESCVYSSLDGLIAGAVADGGKVLVFSDLREGVTDYLKGRWSRHNPVITDGNKAREVEDYEPTQEEIDKREFCRQKFQRDPRCKILISTNVMNEGVDLTAATHVIHLRLPYTPYEFDQRNFRSGRIGEVEKERVFIYTLKTKLDNLDTIDQGIEDMLIDKRKFVDFFQTSPEKITMQMLRDAENGHNSENSNLQNHLKSPRRMLQFHINKRLKNRGFRRIADLYSNHPSEARLFANLYAEEWEGNYGGNTANLYGQAIKLLGQNQRLERKVDLASGPFSLSRTIKEAVTNVDINPFMLEAGRILESRGIIVAGNRAIQGYLHDTKLDSNSFDLALCSLALHCTKLKIGSGKDEILEREQAFREINRILRPAGYGIITLPTSILREKDFGNFYSALEQLGFEVLPFSGFYRGAESEKFRVYMAGLRKKSEPCKEKINPELLTWKMDMKSYTKKESKNKRKGIMKDLPIVEKVFVNKFVNTSSGRLLEECVVEGM